MPFYQQAYSFFFIVFIFIIPVAMSCLADHFNKNQFFPFLSIDTTLLTDNFLFEKNYGGKLCAQSY